MDLTALLLLEPQSEARETFNPRVDAIAPTWSAAPKGLLPLQGRPLIFRLVESLAISGVRKFRIISAASTLQHDVEHLRRLLTEKSKQTVTWVNCAPADLWETAIAEADNAFADRAGAVLLARCNAYFELGSPTAFAHCTQLSFARLSSQGRSADVYWCMPAGRADLAVALRSQLITQKVPSVNAITYLNPLSSAKELRQLTTDVFNLRLAFRPHGKEIRPGVWVGERARIHKTARLVAPAFIGAGTKIRAAALITRASSIEHHCEVDCGTVVQSSNVLPYTYVGAGLELLHAVAGASHIANAAKHRTAEINDPKLLREMPGAPAMRVVTSAGKLASFLPKQVLRTLKATMVQPKASSPDIGKTAISTALPAAAETALAAGLAATSVTRDHGNE